MHHTSLDDIQLINLIARLGSFAAAAEHLGIPRPNVTRRVKQLEEFLGVLLFQRSTRRLSLTAEGEEFIVHSRAIELQWNTAVDRLQSKQHEPSGQLKIWALGIISRMLAGQCLTDFSRRYPGIEIEMMSSWSNLHVRKFDADLILDTLPLNDKSFISEPITLAKHDFYATPTYLARHGVPKHPTELPNYELIIHNAPHFENWAWMDEHGKHCLKVEGKFKFEEVEAAMSMTLSHHGICWLPTFLCDYFQNRQELVRLFEGRYATEITLYAIYPRSQFQSARVRLFIEMVKSSGLFGTAIEARTP
jgi:LysR family transcriptional regulator for bpeEF and oprC